MNGIDIKNEYCIVIEECIKMLVSTELTIIINKFSLAWSHACLNPILYGLKAKSFRKRIGRSFDNFCQLYKGCFDRNPFFKS